MTEFEKILIGKICPYCKCETELVSGKIIFGQSSKYGGMYYRCKINPDHYVGTYKDGIKSLGSLADKELREWRSKGHSNFDPLWKEKPKFFRSKWNAYEWLSKVMGVERRYAHFGMFSIEQCEKSIFECIELKRKINNLTCTKKSTSEQS